MPKPNEGWITGPALELALQLREKGIKAGDEVYCDHCKKVHTVTGWVDGGISFAVVGASILPDDALFHITAWRPKR